MPLPFNFCICRKHGKTPHVSRILLHISHQFFQLLLLQLQSLMNIAKSKMLKTCQAPWCTAHRYSSFPAKSHIFPVSLPNVHSLLAAELGSTYIYWAEGSFLLPFERMQHFTRINFRTLRRRTSLLFGADSKKTQRQTHLGGQRERRKLECLHQHALTLIRGRRARVEELGPTYVRILGQSSMIV